MTELIAYTINGNVMKGTILSKGGQVRYTSSPTIPYMEGASVGKTFIVAEIGGKLRLVASTVSRATI